MMVIYYEKLVHILWPTLTDLFICVYIYIWPSLMNISILMIILYHIGIWETFCLMVMLVSMGIITLHGMNGMNGLWLWSSIPFFQWESKHNGYDDHDQYPLVMTNSSLLSMVMYNGFTHWKWWFSIVMLVYQRVLMTTIPKKKMLGKDGQGTQVLI